MLISALYIGNSVIYFSLRDSYRIVHYYERYIIYRRVINIASTFTNSILYVLLEIVFYIKHTDPSLFASIFAERI